MRLKSFFKKYRLEFFIFFISFAFSWWLMFSTFSYKDENMLISSKAWSDFASHIPLIRSFSFGENLPPQYPLFSGPPMKYHFVFYAFVGFLEKLGLRIDFALNIPTALGFSFLILMIYLFAKKIFKSEVVGILSILFFLLNGSLSFLNLFSKYPLSQNTIFEIISNRQFPSFGPYDQSIISAFWNLNIYTNQRHLALSYAVSMLLIFLLIKPALENKKQDIKISLFIGPLLGLTFFLNIAVFLMTVILLGILSLLFKNHRKRLLLSAIVGIIISIPQYLFTLGENNTPQISVYIGYLTHENLGLLNIVNYWFQNLGLHLILIPLGFFIAPKGIKKIFIAFFALFAVGNLFTFSPEVAANHKFFNFFMIVGSMFSAYAIYYIWNNKKIFRPLVPVLFFLLIFSGIIDFFPIYNDSKITLADYPLNKDVSWIMKNTKPDSVFLNTNYLYDNASLAGRKIFLGWPYFAWSQGYDTLKRDNLRKDLLNSSDLKSFCKESIKNKIDFAELNLNSKDIVVNKKFFDNNFPLVYKNGLTEVYIYEIKDVCL